jgi:hypothetical protein
MPFMNTGTPASIRALIRIFRKRHAMPLNAEGRHFQTTSKPLICKQAVSFLLRRV